MDMNITTSDNRAYLATMLRTCVQTRQDEASYVHQPLGEIAPIY